MIICVLSPPTRQSLCTSHNGSSPITECCKGLCPQTTPEADCHISQGPDRLTDGMLNLDDLEEDTESIYQVVIRVWGNQKRLQYPGLIRVGATSPPHAWKDRKGSGYQEREMMDWGRRRGRCLKELLTEIWTFGQRTQPKFPKMGVDKSIET